MSDYKVSIKIAGQLEQSFASSIKAAQNTLNTMGNSFTKVGKAMTAGITVPLVALGASSVQEFGNVDKSLKLVQATMGSSAEEAAELEAAIKNAAAASVFGMQDAADATLNFARQGFNASQAADMLTPALNLAAGTATDLSEVTGGLGNALKMFGKDSSYASTAADILSKAQAQANTTVSDLFEAMATAGPICKSVGWEMSDLATITDIFGDAGISGAEGATALKTGLARLASPAKDGAAWMEKLGLNIFNTDGTMKSMVDVQKQLHDSFAGLNSEQKLAAASAIFGKNQMAKWLTLIDAAPEQVQKYSSALEECSGTSQKMADALLSGMGGSLEKLASSFDVFKYNIGSIASEYLKPIVDNITKVIDAFNNMDPAMQKNIVKWIGIAAVAGPAFLILGKIFKIAGSVVGIFGKLGKAAGVLGSGVKKTVDPVSQSSTVMSAAAKNALGFGVGLAAAAGGVWILVQAAKEIAQAGPETQVALLLMGAGIAGLMVVASQVAPKMQAGAQGLLAFGGAVLMVSAGMSLMAFAATQLASAGPMALAGLALMEAGIIGLLAVAGAMGATLATATPGLLAFGGAILMAAVGMGLLTIAAMQLSSAGTGAVIVLAGMGAGLIAFMAVAALLGPMLTSAAVGLVAFGASIILAATGMLLMTQAATQLATAGPAAQIAMALLAAGILAFGAVAGLLAPLLLAGAGALAAFGAALMVVGAAMLVVNAAAIVGAAALMMIAAVLPQLATSGLMGSVAILALGTSMTLFAAGAALAGAGAAAAAIGFAALAVAALAADVAFAPLAVEMAAIGAAIAVMATMGKTAAESMESLKSSSKGMITSMGKLAASLVAPTAALVPFAAAVLAASVPAAALAAALALIVATITLMAAAVTMANMSLTMLNMTMVMFRTNATSMNASATIIAAAFTKMSTGIQPTASAMASLSGPTMQTAQGMRTLAQALLLSVQTFTIMRAAITATGAAFTSLVSAFAGTTVIAAGVTMMSAAVRTGMVTVSASMKTGMTQVTTDVRNGMMQSQAATTAGMALIVAVSRSGMTTMVAVYRSGGQQIIAICRSTASGINSTFASVNLYSSGVNMMAGLQAGISAKGAAVIATARNIAQQAAAAVNSALQIHSPSRLMMRSGEYVDEGLAVGMEKNSGMVQSAAIASLATPIMDTSQNIRNIETPQTTAARSAVIGETVNNLSGKQLGGGRQENNDDKQPTFVFSPTYQFYGEAPSKDDIVEANRMSQREFEKMMKEYERKNRRTAFA